MKQRPIYAITSEKGVSELMVYVDDHGNPLRANPEFDLFTPERFRKDWFYNRKEAYTAAIIDLTDERDRLEGLMGDARREIQKLEARIVWLETEAESGQQG